MSRIDTLRTGAVSTTTARDRADRDPALGVGAGDQTLEICHPSKTMKTSPTTSNTRRFMRSTPRGVQVRRGSPSGRAEPAPRIRRSTTTEAAAPPPVATRVREPWPQHSQEKNGECLRGNIGTNPSRSGAFAETAATAERRFSRLSDHRRRISSAHQGIRPS